LHYYFNYLLLNRTRSRFKIKKTKEVTHTARIQSNTHAREQVNSTLSRVNQSGSVSDLFLSITMSFNISNNYYGIVREVHKNVMKLQTSTRLNLMREIILLHTEINSCKALDICDT